MHFIRLYPVKHCGVWCLLSVRWGKASISCSHQIWQFGVLTSMLNSRPRRPTRGWRLVMQTETLVGNPKNTSKVPDHELTHFNVWDRMYWIPRKSFLIKLHIYFVTFIQINTCLYMFLQLTWWHVCKMITFSMLTITIIWNIDLLWPYETNLIYLWTLP